MRLLPAGDRGVLVEVDDLPAVLELQARLRSARLPGVVDLVPAARTVLVVLDPTVTSCAAVGEAVRDLPPAGGASSAGPTPVRPTAEGPVVEVPVVYDGADLDEIGRSTGWGAAEVVRRHTGTTWTVAFGGFAPGFAYAVADTGPAWDVPRHREPRTRVPAGSVALADAWTGVYPTASPGGWQLLGRTDAVLWDLERDPPALLHAGVRVRFVAVGR